MLYELTDTNNDKITIVRGIGDNLIYLEGSYWTNHIYHQDELFNFLGTYLGYDVNEVNLIRDTKFSMEMKPDGNYIDFFNTDKRYRSANSSISKYTAKKLFSILGKELNIDIA